MLDKGAIIRSDCYILCSKEEVKPRYFMVIREETNNGNILTKDFNGHLSHFNTRTDNITIIKNE